MTDLAEQTMSYEGLVAAGRAAREQADSMQWVEGDLALQVEVLPLADRPRDPETGEFIADETKALQQYAVDIEINYATLKDYRRVADAWPRDWRAPTAGWRTHRELAAHPDRLDLIKGGLSYREAQKIVRQRTAETLIERNAEIKRLRTIRDAGLDDGYA